MRQLHFRGIDPGGANLATTSETAADGGKTIFVEFEPYRRQSKLPAFRNLRIGDLRWDVPANATDDRKSAKVDASDLTTRPSKAAKWQRREHNAPAAAAAEAAEDTPRCSDRWRLRFPCDWLVVFARWEAYNMRRCSSCSDCGAHGEEQQAAGTFMGPFGSRRHGMHILDRTLTVDEG